MIVRNPATWTTGPVTKLAAKSHRSLAVDHAIKTTSNATGSAHLRRSISLSARGHAENMITNAIGIAAILRFIPSLEDVRSHVTKTIKNAIRSAVTIRNATSLATNSISNAKRCVVTNRNARSPAILRIMNATKSVGILPNVRSPVILRITSVTRSATKGQCSLWRQSFTGSGMSERFLSRSGWIWLKSKTFKLLVNDL